MQNRFQHAVQIDEHLGVPEADDVEAPLDEKPVARLVADRRVASTVLVSVQLNDKHRLQTGEVGDIWADRMLTTNPITREPPVFYTAPKKSFGRRHRSPQAPCAGVRLSHGTLRPPPAPVLF